MEDVICEELPCLTEVPRSILTTEKAQLYWNNVLCVPLVNNIENSTTLDAFEQISTPRTIPLNLNFNLVDLTLPEVVQFRNKLRPKSTSAPALIDNTESYLDTVFQLSSSSSSLRVPQDYSPVLDQDAFLEIGSRFLSSIVSKNRIPVEDLDGDMTRKGISSGLNKIEIDDQINSKKSALGRLMLEADTRSQSSLMEVPLMSNFSDYSFSENFYPTLIQGTKVNQSVEEFEIEIDIESKEDQSIDHFISLVNLSEMTMDDMSNKFPSFLFVECTSLVPKESTIVSLTFSDFLPDSSEIDDCLNTLAEELSEPPKQLTNESLLDLFCKELELNCGDLTLPPVIVPSLERDFSHKKALELPDEYLGRRSISNSGLNWIITHQEFNSALSKDSMHCESGNTILNPFIGLLETLWLPDSSKQRLNIQTSIFFPEQDKSLPRVNDVRQIKRLKVNSAANMDFFMQLKNRSSPQTNTPSRLRVTVQELDCSPLIKDILNILTTNWNNLLNRLPASFGSRQKQLKLLDQDWRIPSNSECLSRHAKHLTESLNLLKQTAIAVLDRGPLAAADQLKQILDSSSEANSDMNKVLSAIHSHLENNRNNTVDPRLECIGKIFVEPISKNSQIVVLLDQAVLIKFLPILEQRFNLQCCLLNLFGTEIWKTSRCLLLSYQDLMKSSLKDQCSEFIKNCTTLVEVCDLGQLSLLDQNSWLNRSRLESLGIKYFIQLKMKMPELEPDINRIEFPVRFQQNPLAVVLNRQFSHNHNTLYSYLMKLERMEVIALSERSCVCDMMLPLCLGFLLFGPLSSFDRNLVQDYSSQIEKSAVFCMKITVFLQCPDEVFDQVVQCWSPLKKKVNEAGIIICINHYAYFEQCIDAAIKQLSPMNNDHCFTMSAVQSRLEKMLNNSGCFSPFVSYILNQELMISDQSGDSKQYKETELMTAKEELCKHWESWHQRLQEKWTCLGEIQRFGFEQFCQFELKSSPPLRNPSLSRSSPENSKSIELSDFSSISCSNSGNERSLDSFDHNQGSSEISKSSNCKIKQTNKFDLEQFRFNPNRDSKKKPHQLLSDVDDTFVSFFEDFDDWWNKELISSEDKEMPDSSSTNLNSFLEISGLNESVSSEQQTSLESCFRSQSEKETNRQVPSFRNFLQKKQKTHPAHSPVREPEQNHTQIGPRKRLFLDYSALKRTSKNTVEFL
eukprot:g6121.t1